MSRVAVTTVPPEERSYSVEEVGEVIRTATALVRTSGGSVPAVPEALGFAELLELARELGIDREQLLQAIPEAAARRQRALTRTRRKMRFWRHLLTFGTVLGGLTVVDVLAGPGYWVQWPAVFWGIGLTMHGLRTFVTGRGGRLHDAVYRKELEAEGR